MAACHCAFPHRRGGVRGIRFPLLRPTSLAQGLDAFYITARLLVYEEEGGVCLVGRM
ncbi:hypothetical protein U2A4042590043 [Corynebacterium striatum]|nr:hypothetical protein U2A4042590043 [Corynebacterium striatum]